MLNRSASLAMSTSVLKALPGKLDIKRHSPSILYISASLAMSTSVLKALPGKLDIERHSPSILYLHSRCQSSITDNKTSFPQPSFPYIVNHIACLNPSLLITRSVDINHHANHTAGPNPPILSEGQ